MSLIDPVRQPGATVGTTEERWEAIAASLVMTDISNPDQRAAFASQVSASSDELGADPTLAAATEQLLATLAGIDAGDDLTTALGVLSEIASAALQLAAEADAAAADSGSSAVDSPRTLAPDANAYTSDPALVAEFLCGAREQLDEAEALLSAAAIGGTVDVGALFRCFHTLKGTASFLSLDDFTEVAHDAESVLDAVRSDKREMADAEVEQALEAVDVMRGMLASVEAPAQAGAASAAPGSSAAPAAPAPAHRRGPEHVRVNAHRLEELLDAMGELAVAETELAAAVMATGDSSAMRCLERLSRISRDMQGTSTALRMVTLKQTFAKMARVVRDGVARSGKSAELVISGENTEIDRAMVEGLTDPLVHLLRNAVDHGIEEPALRRELGKSESGRIELRAFHRSGSIFIEITDDGRGIDPERLIRRAHELGIEFDREHPHQLIFEPGFSTADTLTELSGRGVGMDAVSSAVAGLRGQLDITSEPGVGTTFTIRLPLTLAIIDGIVMRAGAERYVVPTHFVERTASVAGAQVVSAAGRGEVLVLPDGPVPVTPITRVMGGAIDTGDVAVILMDGDERFALVVDEVIGQHSLVIKPLTGPTTAAVGAAGAALMGDGRVALVVDPTGLSRALRRGS